jgi:hypothetical protein
VNIEIVLQLLFACTVLLAGRSFYWLLIALIGFLIGVELANTWFVDQARWLVICAGLGAGLVGAVLAIFFQRLAFAIAGFLAAAYLTMVLGKMTGFTEISQLIVLVAGIAGAILTIALTDWVIIFLSAIAGAAAIASIVTHEPGFQLGILLGLAALGVAVQGVVLRRKRAP